MGCSGGQESTPRHQRELDELKRVKQENERLRRKEHDDLLNIPRPAIIGEARPYVFNVAICGDAGVGKSTGINTLFRTSGEVAPAETGITETTREPQAYTLTCPLMLNLLRLAFGGENTGALDWGARAQDFVVRWLAPLGVTLTPEDNFLLRLVDHPGANTPNVDSRTYIRTYGLTHYDYIFLVTKDRLSVAERLVHDQCVARNIPHAVVRSNFDLTMYSDQRERRIKGAPIRTEEEIKAEILRNFETHNVGADIVYFVDMMNFFAYDFVECFKNVVCAALAGRQPLMAADGPAREEAVGEVVDEHAGPDPQAEEAEVEPGAGREEVAGDDEDEEAGPDP